MGSESFQFFWGAASGSAQKALRKLEESHVMLSYATKNHYPWDEIQSLFVDSGAYSVLQSQSDYPRSNSEYLDYIERYEPAFFALRDYVCSPDIRSEHGVTVSQQQQRTIDRHRELLGLIEDRGLASVSSPVAVLQGWNPEDYVEHFDMLRDRGLLTPRVGIGTLSRTNNAEQVRRIILRVREELPEKYRLHGFGVKRSVLKYPEVVDALASADSCAYEYDQYMDNHVHTAEPTSKDWRDYAFFYLRMKRRVDALVGDAELDRDSAELRGQSQQSLDQFS